MFDLSGVTEVWENFLTAVRGMPGSRHYYEALWLFFLFGVLGWLAETVFCAIRDRRFTYRGFLNGPFCPVYGVGILLFIVVTHPLRSLAFPWRLLIGIPICTVAAGLLEWVTGLLLRRAFHQKWRDESGKRGNLGGYLVWYRTVLFGVLGSLAVVLRPVFAHIIAATVSPAASILLAVLVILFLLDLILTLLEVAQIARKRRGASELLGLMKLTAPVTGEELYRAAEAVAAKKEDPAAWEELAEQLAKYRSVFCSGSAVHRRIARAFPALRHEQLLDTVSAFRDLYARIRRNK